MRRRLAIAFFDLDGTLVDSRRDIVLAVQHGLQRIGLPPLPDQQIASHVGHGLENLIRKNLGPKNQHRFAELTEAFRRHYARHMFDHTTLYQDVETILDAVAAIPLAVVSNKSRPFVERMLSHFRLAPRFLRVFSGDDEDWHKPEIRGLRQLLRSFNIPRREALLVGDMPVDVKTARRAGINSYILGRGFSRPAELRAAGAEHVHRGLSGIIRLYRPIRPSQSRR